jgi:hypothetical protein
MSGNCIIIQTRAGPQKLALPKVTNDILISVFSVYTKLETFSRICGDVFHPRLFSFTYPGAELILTPPAAPEPVLIDEGMGNNMLNEYKSHFPKGAPATEIH